MFPSIRRYLALAATLTGCAASVASPLSWSAPAATFAPSDMRAAWRLNRFGSDGFDSIAAVAAMPDGGLVIAGHFEGDLELGSDRLVSKGATDAFIARLGSDGEVEWAERLGGAGFDAGAAVVLDRDGHPILIGDLSGSVTVGDRNLRARGESDAFAASFGPDGAVRWVTAFGGPDWDTAAGAAVTSDDHIAVVGTAGRTAREVDGVRSGDADVLVALIESSGRLRWTRRFGGAEWDQGFAVAAEREGDIAVGGAFAGRMRAGDASLVSAGRSDGFVMRVTREGTIRRAERLGGAGEDAVTALAIAPDGTSTLAGYFSDTVLAGKESLVSAGGSDLFVARADAEGEPVWAFRAGGDGEDAARALFALPDGSTLVAGAYSLALELVAGDGPSEIVLHHVGESGARRDLVRVSGSFLSARGLAVTRERTAAMVGSFAHRARLGSRTVTSEDGLDGFVMMTPLATWGK